VQLLKLWKAARWASERSLSLARSHPPGTKGASHTLRVLGQTFAPAYSLLSFEMHRAVPALAELARRVEREVRPRSNYGRPANDRRRPSLDSEHGQPVNDRRRPSLDSEPRRIPGLEVAALEYQSDSGRRPTEPSARAAPTASR